MIVTAASQSKMGMTGVWTWSELTEPTGQLCEVDESHVIPTRKKSVSPEPALPVHAPSSSATTNTTTPPAPATSTTTSHEPAFHSVPASTGLVSWTAGPTGFNIKSVELTTTSTTAKLSSPSQSVSSFPSSLLSTSSSCSSSLSASELQATIRTFQDPPTCLCHQTDPTGATITSVSSAALDPSTSYLDIVDYTNGPRSEADGSTATGLCDVDLAQPGVYESVLPCPQWSTFHSLPSIQSYHSLEVEPVGGNEKNRYVEDSFIEPTTKCSSQSADVKHQWDIKDVKLPKVTTFDTYEQWPTGHCRRVYPHSCERARRHQSGWAMRNTNNHNPQVLKKSCLGVLECSVGCVVQGKPLSLRPAICDKARKKQTHRPCITPGCPGRLVLRNCRGHSGYPVTHFWRFANGAVYFEAKGEHDHNRPSLKTFGLSENYPSSPLSSTGSTCSVGLVRRDPPSRQLLLPGLPQASELLSGLNPSMSLLNQTSTDALCLPSVLSTMSQRLTGQESFTYSNRTVSRTEKKKTVRVGNEKRDKRAMSFCNKLPRLMGLQKPTSGFVSWDLAQTRPLTSVKRGRRGLRRKTIQDDIENLMIEGIMGHMTSPTRIQPVLLPLQAQSQISQAPSFTSPIANHYPLSWDSQPQWQPNESVITTGIQVTHEEQQVNMNSTAEISVEPSYHTIPVTSMQYMHHNISLVPGSSMQMISFEPDTSTVGDTKTQFYHPSPVIQTSPQLPSSNTSLLLDCGTRTTPIYSGLPVALTYSSLSSTQSSYYSDPATSTINSTSVDQGEFAPLEGQEWCMQQSPTSHQMSVSVNEHIPLQDSYTAWPTDGSELACCATVHEEFQVPNEIGESVNCKDVVSDSGVRCFDRYYHPHHYTWTAEQLQGEQSIIPKEQVIGEFPVESIRDSRCMELLHLREWLSRDPQPENEWNQWSNSVDAQTAETCMNYTGGNNWPSSFYSAGLNTDSQVAGIHDSSDWIPTPTPDVIPNPEPVTIGTPSYVVTVPEHKCTTRIPTVDELFHTLTPDLSGATRSSDTYPSSRTNFLTTPSSTAPIEWTDSDRTDPMSADYVFIDTV
ncbi:Glial cells missing 2 [Fasciola gigantica]|uniref:Glial cells missing 2 n=1 Tax=Fasciola gigantica TaxID=46835 RepID=A0A504Z5M9_FASGI|nr:Glial cells missing 2 [Fasciola gigantica]